MTAEDIPKAVLKHRAMMGRRCWSSSWVPIEPQVLKRGAKHAPCIRSCFLLICIGMSFSWHLRSCVPTRRSRSLMRHLLISFYPLSEVPHWNLSLTCRMSPSVLEPNTPPHNSTIVTPVSCGCVFNHLEWAQIPPQPHHFTHHLHTLCFCDRRMGLLWQ